ncbi:sensor histidine kinase [Streptosporangium saharense]|uniref:histidine kinase n=1 Tax=Streptosporangium saharense TaxID=1706840 RepID=A0A7W7QL96_9ACTN|nr:histidine kinase [Streptosporangium saharense]MBB4915617.1 signal transduction histidine kinase [Streptosporangium saharense]
MRRRDDRPAAGLMGLARWSPLPVDALLAAVIFLVTLGPGQVLPRGEPGPLLLQVALTMPLVWRRRAPLTVFCVVGAAAAVQWAADVQLPADAALLVALYTVGAHRPLRPALAAALALEAGVVLAAARWAPPGQFPFSVAALTAMAAAALTTGLWTRARLAHVASLEHDREQRARLAVAEERARMTRDMHDIVTHNLSVMVALADSAAHVRHRAPERAADVMEQVADIGRRALEDMRRSLNAEGPSGLSADEPGDAPLHPAPGIAQLGPLADRMRAAGLPTRLRVAGDPELVPAAAQLTIYRLAQEALTNTLRHAPGARAEVRVHLTPRRAEVEVTDDGRPGRPDRTAKASPGRGLTGMRERVAVHDGTLDAGPARGGGWRVAASLNLDGEETP